MRGSEPTRLRVCEAQTASERCSRADRTPSIGQRPEFVPQLPPVADALYRPEVWPLGRSRAQVTETCRARGSRPVQVLLPTRRHAADRTPLPAVDALSQSRGHRGESCAALRKRRCSRTPSRERAYAKEMQPRPVSYPHLSRKKRVRSVAHLVKRTCCGVDLVTQSQDLFVLGNVAHAVSVVNKTSNPGLVDEHLGWHPT